MITSLQKQCGKFTMTNDIKLLDCTLRDGGYVNDWRFGNLTIRSILSRLDSAGIDIIELGFLDSRVEYDVNRSIYPDIPSIEKTLGACIPNNAEIVAMIDFGTFHADRLLPKDNAVIDGIRLIFQKEKAAPALEYAKRIKAQGYKLYLNLVATYSYSPLELLKLVELINKIEPAGVSIVDTYGVMFDDEMIRYSYLLADSLNAGIAIGYHSHNNLNISDANCITYTKLDLNRNKIIDASILGMGKNSGNAHTEIIASYFNKKRAGKFDIDQILECAVTDVQRFLTTQEWGYNLNNLVTAICECSPNWIKYYTNKGMLSISNIRSILSALPADERKLVSYFSQGLAEEKFREFCSSIEPDDNEARKQFSLVLQNRNVLILCPGKTLREFSENVTGFINSAQPLVIAVNFVTDQIPIDYLYIGNNKRYSQLSALIGNGNVYRVISTSNVIPNGTLTPEHTFSYSKLRDSIQSENSAVMLLNLLVSLDVKNVAIAGFDGFEDGINNYYENSLSLNGQTASNEPIFTDLKRLVAKHNVTIHFITPSLLQEMI
jgi:4-hydroxy 2-oxovalerate aldolase